MTGNISKAQQEIIKDNLKAFENDFGEVRLEQADYGNGIYVYFPANAQTYIQYCYNSFYLDGWLYGCVQGFMRGEFKENAKI